MGSTPEYVICLDCETPCYEFEWDDGEISEVLCLTCGNIACCDSSPERHANAHFEQTGHPVMRSAEPGESWRWCFVDRLTG